VVHANRAGESQARAGHALRIVQNRLSPTNEDAGSMLARALADGGGFDDKVIANMHSIAMPSGEGEGLIATILPVGEGERANLMSPRSARWAVFSQSPGSVPRIPGEAFARLYGLTGGELRVVLAVANGMGAKEAAELLGLSEPTVRTHLQRAFEKTGTSRQAELIKLMMASTPPLKKV